MIKARKLDKINTILVVDDQEINRDALGAILEDEYEILYAENGRRHWIPCGHTRMRFPW